MTYPRIRRALLCALISCSALTSPLAAQSTKPYENVDANGVDLTDGSFNFKIVEGSVGDGPGRITITRNVGRGGSVANWDYQLGWVRTWTNQTIVTISKGRIYDQFTLVAGAYVAKKANGSKLVGSGSNYTYTDPDGNITNFGPLSSITGGPVTPFCGSDPNETQCVLMPLSAKMTSGLASEFNWDVSEECEPYIDPDTGLQPCSVMHYRFGGVANAAGYGFNIVYASNSTTSKGRPTNSGWWKRTGISLGTAGSITYSYPASGVTEVTTQGGQLWRITEAANATAIRRPGAASDTMIATYGTNGVTSVIQDGVTTNYNRTLSGAVATTVVTNALSQQTTVVADMNLYRPTSFKNALNKTTLFAYDTNGRLTETTAPEGDKLVNGYDTRGNVISQTLKAKSGSGLTDIVMTANYDVACSNAVKCNKPNWTKDAKGNQTDYTYDPTHGGVATVTSPADANGVRPQTRYSYTQVNGIYMPTGVSTCRTGASCTGTVDESKTAIVYNSNLLPQTVTQSAGDNSLTTTTNMTYTAAGDVKTVDGPLPGTGDTTSYRYNSGRQMTGVVGPDPDGAGTRAPAAQRASYNNAGQLIKTETGTVASASDADWTSFTPAQAVETSYDTHARPVKQELKAAGTTHSVTQTSYDALGRVECSAQRMDPAQWASQTNACAAQTSGPNGPDRISKQVYDAAGQVTKLQTAVGTPDQADEVSATYTANGKVETVTDGENNRTTYVYDGHDRLSQTRYPLPTQGANASSTSDYEQLSYDANNNVTQRRLRDGQLVNFGYDNLGRVTTKDRPGSEADASYGYALTGALKTATEGGKTITLGYDPLGRLTTQSDGTSTFTSAYDLAGNRTRLTYPDSFYVDYSRDVAGNVTAIRENGAASGVGVLATYAYDNMGRPTSVTYGNGTSRSFSYDPASRLATLGVTLPAAPTSNLSQSFTYNPASQIASVTRSNDAYASNGLVNRNDSATVNGLNQMTAQGSVSLTHDTRGNITGVGASAYSYSSDNSLKTGPAGTSLAYDPLGRLQSVTQGSTITRFGYDGGDLVTERDGSNILTRRYVHGPGTDAPIVWYEGAGTTDRRFLHADERGSIVAVTNSTGGVVGTNRYDDYGVPAATNIGRFQYTGQTWMPELGLYNYKARFYDPKLGRFLQTDPIGYGDGMNMYAYVSGDPVNMVDPSGLGECTASDKAKMRSEGKSEAEIADTTCVTGGSGSSGGGFSGGGGSFGGGGASGGWGGSGSSGGASKPKPSIVKEIEEEIVVTATKAAKTKESNQPKIYFGWPSQENKDHHIDIHLTHLTGAQKQRLLMAIRNFLRNQFSIGNSISPRYHIEFQGMRYRFGAYYIQKEGIINVGTVYPDPK